MTLSRLRLLGASLWLSIVATGCGLMGDSSGVTPTPLASVGATTAAEVTPRPRRTPDPAPLASDDVAAASVEPTPRRTRRPRPSVEPSVPPSPTPLPTPPPTPMPPIPGLDEIAGSDGRLTVLLLGSDARKELPGERTDTIMVATIDPTSGRISMVSLPRDTVNVPIGDGEVYSSPSRINGLLQQYQVDGAGRKEALRRLTRAMAYAFDVEIDGYVVIGFRGMERLIDRIGGIDVFLDRALWDPTMHVTKKGLKLKAGINHLNGKRALAFARTRHTDSDYQRAARQQQVIIAAATKVLENGLDSLPALAELALTQVETDLPLSALPVIAELADRARLKAYKSIVLAPYTYADDGPELYTIEMKLDVVRALFDRLFGPI